MVGQGGDVPKPGTFGAKQKAYVMAVHGVLKPESPTAPRVGWDSLAADLYFDHDDDIEHQHAEFCDALRVLVGAAEAAGKPAKETRDVLEFLGRIRSSPNAMPPWTVRKLLSKVHATIGEWRAVDSEPLTMEQRKLLVRLQKADGAKVHVTELRAVVQHLTDNEGNLAKYTTNWLGNLRDRGLVGPPRKAKTPKGWYWATPLGLATDV